MRKALLVTSALVVLICLSFSKDVSKGVSSLKYNYVVESDLSLVDFSIAFSERLKSKHHWSEVSHNNCEGESCTSVWSFADEESNQWKCEVVIRKADEGVNRMLVTMEMNPVLGS
jgi:hypothetical protein